MSAPATTAPTIPATASKASRPWHVDLDRPVGRHHIDETATLIVMTWLTVVLPRVLQSLTAPKHQTLVNDSIPYSRTTAAVGHAMTLLLLGTCVVIIGRRLRAIPVDRRRVLVLLLAPWVYLVCRDLYAGVHLHVQDLEYPALVIAAWFLRPRLQRLVLLGYLGAALTVLSLLMGIFLPAKGIYHAVGGDLVSPDKKILPWGILVGPLSSENNLGQVLVLGLPLIGLAPRRSVRVVVVLLTAFAILWTSSRSSLAALGAGALIAVALRVRSDQARRVIASAFLVAAGTLCVVIPTLSSGGPAFSNRGYIWKTSLRAWAQHRMFGLGTQWYSSLASYEEGLGGDAFHGHNTFVQTVATGGLVALLLVGVMALIAIGSAVRWAGRRVTFPAVLLCTFLVSATLEVSFAFFDRDFLLAATVLPMAFILFAAKPSMSADGDAGPLVDRGSGPASGVDHESEHLYPHRA